MNVSLPTPPTGRVLVVDDNLRARESVADILGEAGHTVRCCASAPEALQVLDRETFDVIITDLRMPGMTGLEFIQALEQRGNEAQVVMVTAHASVATAVEAMRHGAFDYIEKPFNVDQLEQLVARALNQADTGEKRSTMPAARPASALADSLIGCSAPMQLLRERIEQIAPTNETVLIRGESGTGKELVARALHRLSRRATGPMVSLNCPALSPQLMESELFGHERGAFTSADAPRVGRFELADGGTILLDEVTEISLPLQAKLLRVLQERSFERVGSSETRRVDVRVVATTNRDIRAESLAGRFREDLYFRLAVVPIVVPPLRERREDVPLLVNHFLRLAAARLERSACVLDVEAERLLCDYSWPGNVRELENIVTRASVLSRDGLIRAADLRAWLGDAPDAVLATRVTVEVPDSAHANLHDMERRMIESTLEQFDGHREKTAKALGIGVRTLSNKLRAYGYAPRAKSFSKAG